MKSPSKQTEKKHIRICNGKNCAQNFSCFLKDRAEAELKENAKGTSITIEEINCRGKCNLAPNVELIQGEKKKAIPQSTGPKMAEAMKHFFGL